MKRIMIILIAISFSFSLSAQQRAVSGRVTLIDSIYLSNIKVTAKKAGTKTLTDSLGYFAIVCNQSDVLEFTGETFYKLRKRVKPTVDTVNIQMQFTESPENVEIAVGYGYISKKDAASAISILNNKQDDFCSYSDIFELIEGKCPGISVSSQGNDAGAEQEIIIRGQSSFSSSSGALYVVDGLTVNDIRSIVPCDVKSISFLKDGAAAIYGSKGGGGVVIIETRTGK